MKIQTISLIAVIAAAISMASADTYATWTDDMFDPEESALTDPNADPDGDGMNNLLEYALDGDPLYSDAADVLPTPILENGKLVLDFKRDTSRADVVLSVVHSADLKTWAAIASELITTRKSIEKRRVTLDPVAAGAGFLRMRAVRP